MCTSSLHCLLSKFFYICVICVGSPCVCIDVATASHLIRAGGLVGAVVIAVVLVGLCGLRIAIGTGAGLVDGRDVVAQRNGLHRLMDAAAHALADLGRRRLLGLAAWRGGTRSRGGAAASTGPTTATATGLLEMEQDQEQRSDTQSQSERERLIQEHYSTSVHNTWGNLVCFHCAVL